MLKAQWCPYKLDFNFTARTSRAVMRSKDTYFIRIFDAEHPEVYGLGECALFRGLSCDDRPEYEDKLASVCQRITDVTLDELADWPSIRFGVETALADLATGGRRIIYPSPWSLGESEITINGLVWMGSIEEMTARVEEKLAHGFRCIKFKVGGEDFEREYALLKSLRSRFDSTRLEIRLDANGAFTPENALQRLERLSRLEIHSIEQPIRQLRWDEMARIIHLSPIPVALDEELIGINDSVRAAEMLERLHPDFIILKPALCGGFVGSEMWIHEAERLGIGWWATSALESNLGLNAIAQWVSTKHPALPQGLGTGQLYTNNIPSPIEQVRDVLIYNPDKKWHIPQLNWH